MSNEKIGATGESLRIRNNDYSKSRSFDGASDIDIVKVNGLDQIEFASVPYANGLPLALITAPNPQEIYIDSVGGDDLLGDGSVTARFKTIEKALTLTTNNSERYVLVLSPGQYGLGAIAIPSYVSIFGFGANINVPVSITSEVGLDVTPFYNGVSMSDVTIDLSLGNISLFYFANGGFGIKRIDNRINGPWLVTVEDGAIGTLDIRGSLIVSDVLFQGGSCIIRTDGQMLCTGDIMGASVDVEGAGNISLLACTMVGTITGTTIGLDTPVVRGDASSLNFGGTITGCTIQYADSASFVGYTPTTSSDWSGAAPTTVAEGLDRCAALLKALNGGTGP